MDSVHRANRILDSLRDSRAIVASARRRELRELLMELFRQQCQSDEQLLHDSKPRKDACA